MNNCQSLLLCHMQTCQRSFAEFVHQSKMLLEAELLTNMKSCHMEHFGRPALNLLPIDIFIVLTIAIINNTSCSSALILKMQIASKILNTFDLVFWCCLLFSVKVLAILRTQEMVIFFFFHLRCKNCRCFGTNQTSKSQTHHPEAQYNNNKKNTYLCSSKSTQLQASDSFPKRRNQM